MNIFQEIVDTICREAGWKRPDLAGRDCVSFHLENDVSLEISALSHRLLLFKMRLGDVPDSEAETDRTCRRLGLMAAASFRKRRAVLSMRDDGFYLHLMVNADHISPKEAPAQCQAFLNDGQWWLSNFSDLSSEAGLSGFHGLGGGF